MSGVFEEAKKKFVIEALEEIEKFISENPAIDRNAVEYHIVIFNIYRLQRLAREIKSSV